MTIACEKDLEEALQRHPDILAAFSGAQYPTKKSAAKAMKKLHTVKCEDDEILCLMDSGSSLNGINVAKEIPEYLPHCVESEASRRGDSAKCANGTGLKHEGKVKVHVEAGGQEFDIDFCNIKTHMPILSVRRVVKNKNRVLFEDEGGHIEIKATGMRIPFFEHEGVYFLKLKIKKPAAQPTPKGSRPTRSMNSKPTTPFARPGRLMVTAIANMFTFR